MKIDGTKPNNEITKKKDAQKTASGNGAFKSLIDGGGGTLDPVAGTTTANIASVDALLMAQAAEDPAQQKAQKRMRERANTLLDRLSDLKMAILTGQVTIGHMVSIADVAALHREKITDPELSALLDEVDLRAQIELAKLQIASKKSSLG